MQPILLVTRNEVRRDIYQEALASLGMDFLTTEDLKEVTTLAARTSLSGILLDMPVMIKAAAHIKNSLQDILNAIPSAYLNILQGTRDIKLLIATGTRGQARNLEEFSALCRSFEPRTVKPKDRYPVHLQTEFEYNNRVEQSVTLDLSYNGCFLFSTNQDYLLKEKVKIVFKGFNDTTPISSTICWIRLWGNELLSGPGLGVKFEQLSVSQSEQLSELLNRII